MIHCGVVVVTRLLNNIVLFSAIAGVQGQGHFYCLPQEKLVLDKFGVDKIANN